VRQATRLPVTSADIEAAAGRIRGVTVRTPLLESHELNEKMGGRVLIKPECLQRTGSFKIRGAYNRLSQLTEQQRRTGVVAWSSGNHAQGIAAAAQLLDVPATIVMPQDAPSIKLEKTRGYGAEIVTYDRQTESREQIGSALANQRGAVLVPSFDDIDIIAGQGTVGSEICQQSAELGVSLDAVLVCCGGGGLSAGVATAVKASDCKTKVYCVEPADFDDHARSLASGQRESNRSGASSFCDALLAPNPGEITFSINQHLLSAGLSVTDAEVAEAMRFALTNLKLVVEPGGAVALAAALSGKMSLNGRHAAVVISGGNVDPNWFADVIGS